MSAPTSKSLARDAIVLAYLDARRKLGARKDLARQLGISPKTLEGIISRLKERERNAN